MKKYIKTTVALLIGFVGIAFAQFSNNEIITYSGVETTKPFIRFKHFEEMRSFPTNELSQEKRIIAINYLESMFHNSNKKAILQAQQPEWRCIGPFNIGGRVKTIAIHPQTEGVVYIGAALGGIWKTTDAGNSWTPIFDNENGIGFGSLCIDVNNPDIIYAATGEAVLQSAAPTYLSSGVYKSIDAGATWFNIGLTNVGAFSKFFVHPLNSKKLVGGVIGMNNGFYYSTDAGDSWNKSAGFTKNVSDVSINPNDENEYFAGVGGEGVYYTSNSGETWEKRSTGLPAVIGRVSVQAAPSNTDILYALVEEEGMGGVGYIYKSTDKGISWARTLKGNAEFFNGQGWYDNYIMVHPTNPDIVFAGGIDVYKTSNGGQSNSSWRNTTNGYGGGNVHVDQHCGAFNPLNTNEIYIGNDGGVYKSKNLGDSYTNLNNGLEITQFYSFDIDQNLVNRTFGGSQDNGTLSNHTNPAVWGWVNGGDGFRTVLDYQEPNIIYGEVASSISVFPFKRNITTGEYKLLTEGLNANDNSGIWDPPLTIHPTENSALYHGRNALYYSLSYGNSWTQALPMQEYKFTAIAVSPLQPEMVYAGDLSGGLYVTKDHFQTYKNVSSNGMVARTVMDIECSSINDETVFTAVSGFGTDHVFKSTDAGESWTSISRNFPDIPCNSIVMHPENEDWLFAGTDIGVFASFNGGQSWVPFGRKLPRTIVTEMKILNKTLTGNYILRAATYGRSIWEVDIPNDIITEYEITSPTGGEVLVGTANHNMSWYGFDKPVKVEITYDNGKNWYVVADDVNNDNLKIKIPNKETFLNRIRVSSKTKPEQVKISNTFSITPVQRGSVLQISSVSFVPYGIAWDGANHLYATSFYGNNLYKLNTSSLLVEGKTTLPGDSLFTDMAINRNDGTLYIHKLNSTNDPGNGGRVIITDKDGIVKSSYISPAKNYPIGLELVDQNLIICDNRSSPRQIYVAEPSSGKVWSTLLNPFQERYGPRGLCYDGEKYLYQACTDFTGSSLVATFLIKIDKDNLEKEIDRMPLIGRGGYINCRGVEFNRSDNNFWVTDFGGNIYKIAGFETTTEIDEEIYLNGVDAACENTTVSYSITSADKYLKKWEVVGASIIGVDTASTVDVLLGQAGTGNVKVILRTATSIIDTLEKNIIISEIPDVSYVSEINEICQKDTLLLTGGLPTGGKYSGKDVENGFFIPKSLGDFEITYIYSKNGCSDSAKLQIVVKPLPAVTYDADVKELCINDEILLSGGLPQGGIFSGTGVNNGLFNPKSQGVFEIKYTYFDGVCSNSDVDTLIAYPLPDKPTISRNNKVLVSSSGITYQWFKDSVAIPLATEKEYLPDEAGKFQVLITDEHDCESISDVYFFDPTGVDNNTTNNLLVISPNPMSDFAIISFGTWGEGQDIDIKIIDIMGRPVGKFYKKLAGGQSSSYIQIDTKLFPSGIYYALFYLNGNIVSRKQMVVIK